MHLSLDGQAFLPLLLLVSCFPRAPTPADLFIRLHPEPPEPGSKQFPARVKSIMPPGLLFTWQSGSKGSTGGPETGPARGRIKREETRGRSEEAEGGEEEIRGRGRQNVGEGPSDGAQGEMKSVVSGETQMRLCLGLTSRSGFLFSF